MTRFEVGRLGAVALTVALLTACSGSSTPSDDVPALGQTLERVDDAIVAGRYDDARRALDELVDTARTAREAGELEGAESDRIVAAADRLIAALPEEPADEPAETPTEEPAAEPTEPPPTEPTEPPSEEETESDEDAAKEAEKEAEREAKEEEKRQDELDKEDEDSGNSGGKGSDKGKGND